MIFIHLRNFSNIRICRYLLGSVVTNVLALEDENDDYEVVIGMDIISRGDFVFTNHEGHSTFSFRIPSEEEIVLK